MKVADPGGRNAERNPVTAVADLIIELLVGLPAHVRFSITPGLLAGHARHVRVRVSNLRVAALRLRQLDIMVDNLHVPTQWPPRLCADRIRMRVRVDQTALDEWTRSMSLPFRFILRTSGVSARTGVAGRRLGEVQIVFRLVAGRLRVAPQRVSVFGLEVNTGSAVPPLTLPLPALPRGALLVGIEHDAGALEVALELNDFDEPLTAERLRSALHFVRVQRAAALSRYAGTLDRAIGEPSPVKGGSGSPARSGAGTAQGASKTAS